MVVSATSNNRSERIRSFKMIKKSEDQLGDCSDQLIKKLFKIHVDYLNDKDEKVVQAVEESLITLIEFKKNLIDKYLDQIIPIVFLLLLIIIVVAQYGKL